MVAAGPQAVRSEDRRSAAVFAGICITFYVLALWYGVSTPIFEPYDEPFHFAYVLALALDHGLPVQDVEHVGPWGNEGSQPPLYYFLLAAATGWFAQPGFAEQVERNPIRPGTCRSSSTTTKTFT